MSEAQGPTDAQDQGPAPGSGAPEIRSASRGLVVVAAGQTDVGCQRKVNQDALGNLAHEHAARADDLGLLYVVADGMGGHARGEVASALAVENIFARYYAADPADHPEKTLARVLVETNTAVHAAGSSDDGNHMGTTVTAALLRGDRLYVGNIGDSRTYRLRDGELRQLSRDHSLIDEQVRSGLLTEEQARSSNIRNVITRALGYRAAVEPDTFVFSVRPGDVLLLCSDGLHGLVEDAELARILQAQPLGQAVASLIELARQRGGHDNITALALRVDAVAPEATRDDATTEPYGVIPADLAAPDAGATDSQPPGGDDDTQPLPVIPADAPNEPVARHDATTQPLAAAPQSSAEPALDDRPTDPLIAAPAAPASQPPAAPQPEPAAAGAPSVATPAAGRRRGGFWLLLLLPIVGIGLLVAFFLLFPRVRGGAATPTPPSATAGAVVAPPAAPEPAAAAGAPTAGGDPQAASASRPGGAGGLAPPPPIRPQNVTPATAGSGRQVEGGDIIIEGSITASPAGFDLARDWDVALIALGEPGQAPDPGRDAAAVAPIQRGADGATTYRLTPPAPGVYAIVAQRRGDSAATGRPERRLCEPGWVVVQRGENLNLNLTVR